MWWLTVCLFLSLGCGGVETNVTPTSLFDPGLKAVPEQIFSSARTENGRLALAGLPGALPPAVRFQIYQEGTPHLLADGMASDTGAFALWLDIQEPRIVIRALSPDQSVWGPDIPITIGTDVPTIRPVSRPLFSASTDPSFPDDTARISGLDGAAPAGQMIVVGGIDTPDAVATFAGGTGEFFTSCRGRHLDRVVLFVVSMTGDGARSVPIEVELSFGDFPVILTPRGAQAPAATAFIAPPGQLKPESTVTVHIESDAYYPQVLVSGQDGAVGGCVPELPLNDRVEVVGTGTSNGSRVAQRSIGAAISEVSVFTEGMQWNFEEGVGVWFQGPVAEDLLSMVAVNCMTGTARQEAVTEEQSVGLPLPASEGDIVAVFGIDRDGRVGVPTFLGADTGEPIDGLIPSLADDQLVMSAVDENGQGVIFGRPPESGAGVLLPHADVEIIGAMDNRVLFDGNASGQFAILMGGLGGSAPLSIVQSRGPYRSDPYSFSMPTYDAEALPLPPAPGLLLAHADGKGRIRVVGHRPAVVGTSVMLANMRTGVTVEIPVQDGEVLFQTELAGDDGDALALVARENGLSSIHAIRPSGRYDVPFLVSAASERVCVMGPSDTAEDVDGIQLQWHATGDVEAMPVLRGVDDSWVALSEEGHFTENSGTVSLWGLSGGTVQRSTADLHALDVDGIHVAGGAAGLRLSDLGGQLDPTWLVAVATPGGAVRIIRPPEKSAWTLPLDLPVHEHVWMFAVHLPSRTASGCHQLDVVMDPLPDLPTIQSIAPNPLVPSKTFSIQGTALTGAIVTVGGVLQDAADVNDTFIHGTVHPATPLGKQPLRITTLSGTAELWVETAPVPTIDTIVPNPLMVGKQASIVGTGFGTNTQVWLGGKPLPVLSATDNLLDVHLAVSLEASIWNLTVYNGVAAVSTPVALTCPPPIVTAVAPDPVLLGDELVIQGDYLWSAVVRVNGQVQTLSESSETMAELTVSAATPLGDGQLSLTTACGTVTAPLAVATSKPVVKNVLPSVAVVGLPFNVYGDHLAGASVQLGGVVQTLTINSKKGLAFVVDAQTPLGDQLMTVSTFGGTTSLVVPVYMPPSIVSVEPAVVSVDGTLTIQGNYLSGAGVSVGDVSASVLSETNTQLKVVVSSGTPAGAQNVVVTTPGGVAQVGVTVLAPPTVAQVLPDPLVRGHSATVSGLNLLDAQLWLDDVLQPLSKVSFGLVEWVVPPETPLGPAVLRVGTPGGQQDLSVTIVEPPVIQSVDPLQLKVGASAVITGTGFDTGGLSVSISGVPQAVSAFSATTIDFDISESNSAGIHLLVVETQYASASLTVEIVQPPKISAVSPSTVVAGGTVNVLGMGLMNAVVTVGGVSALTLTDSATELEVVLNEQTPPGQQQLTVSTLLGESSWPITVLPLSPVVTSVQPHPILVGETIGIEGEYLLGASVKLAGVLVAVESMTATHITGTVSSATPMGANQSLVVQTAGGIAVFPVTVGDESAMGVPSITLVTPEMVPVGTSATVTGFNLKYANLSIAGIGMQVSSAEMNAVTFTIPANTPQGVQALNLTTAQGSASTSITVLPPAPTITTVAPNPIMIGELLAIHGADLGNLQSIELGGVLQNVVTTISDGLLVFQLKDTTPTGQGIVLNVSTLSGSASTVVDVDPAPAKPIDVLDMTPAVVGVGDSVTITGLNLQGVSISIGGAAQSITSAPSDLLVTFVVSPGTPFGNQSVVLSKDTVEDVVLPIGIRPEPPTESLVYLSGLSAAGDAVLVGLPGAFLGDAMVLLDVGNQLQTITAQGDGRLGAVMPGTSAGSQLTIQQSVDGLVSDPMTRTISFSNASSPPTPHAYVTRVESMGGDLHVYGPSPAFGADSSIIAAVSAGQMDYSLAQALHADPTQGMVIAGGGNEGALVWIVSFIPDETQPGSVPLETYALPYDPPILSSGMYAGTLCVAGMAGTVASGVADVAVGDWTVPVLETGSQGGFFALGAYKIGAATPQTWSVQIGPHSIDGSIAPQSLAPLSESDVQVAVDETGGLTITVDATDVGAGRWLVVATNTGEVGVASVASAQGEVTVNVPQSGETIAVWTVPWAGSDPSGCLQLTID